MDCWRGTCWSKSGSLDDDDDNADDGNNRDDDIGEPLSWKIGCVPERVQPWLWHHYNDYGEDADDIVDNDFEW